ncbi:prepilin peptidase [Actinokineospora sp. HUAS TT18]|uniref:prepilin peptidase n=1 Tax=Actinokineospora sp. HUAS TT18 TaxID=3447451 RepID=UPI003F523260
MDGLTAGIAYVMVALVGLAVGSFLNVVIHRVPAGESVVSPPSRCPGCGRAIRARHNVPVVGWLVLRGRCFDCGTAISPRYPLVELGTGLIFLALALRLDPPLWPAYLTFAGVGIALAAIDLDTRTLPSKIILPTYPVLAVLLAGASAVQGDWWALIRAGIGGAALFAFYFLLAMVHPSGMGFGDVRLSGLIGGVLGYLGWGAFAVGAFGGFLLGAVAGVAVVAFGRGGRKTALPFGPFMIAGAIAAVFVGGPIGDWYLRLIS